MANIKSAKKRAIQSEQRRASNNILTSIYRTHVKKVLTAVANKEAAGADAALKVALPVIDKTAAKGIIHKNKAARCKSRLNALVKGIK